MKKIFVILFAAILLAACSDKGGSADVQSNCSGYDRTGDCEVTITNLTEAYYRYTIDDQDFWEGGSVTFNLTATVQTGKVEIWLKDPELKKISTTAEPGQTALLSGRAWQDTLGDKHSFYIYVQPLTPQDSPKAENIQMKIHYDMP